MSGGGISLLFTLGLAIGGAGILYVIYYVTTISQSVSDARVQVRRELAAKEEHLRDAIRESLDQRSDWARNETEDALNRMRAEMAEEQAEFRRATMRTLENLAKQVQVLQTQVTAAAPHVEPPPRDERDSKGRPHGNA